MLDRGIKHLKNKHTLSVIHYIISEENINSTLSLGSTAVPKAILYLEDN